MTSKTKVSNEDLMSTQESKSVNDVKFCPICGSMMTQGEIYDFRAWICPEGDYFEFID